MYIFRGRVASAFGPFWETNGGDQIWKYLVCRKVYISQVGYIM